MIRSIIRSFLIITVLTFVSYVAQAQTKYSKDPKQADPKAKERQALQKSAQEIVAIGKKYLQETAQNTPVNAELNNKEIISMLNKTIEDLEKRAEKQYEKNRWVLIKED